MQMDPDFGKAHNNLGNALRQKGNVKEAIIHYQKALELERAAGRRMWIKQHRVEFCKNNGT